MLELLIAIIVLALLFDLVNGFHDAANSIATVVSTKVLTPFQAVLWAAFFNVLAFWVFDMSVGNTVAKTVDNSAIDLWVILSGLIAATIWNLFTWWLGIPSSSSHTLIGGFAGAAVAHAGFDVINSKEILVIVLFIFFAPIIGGLIAFIITLMTIIRGFWKKIFWWTGVGVAIAFFMNYMTEYLDVSPIIMYIVIGMFAVFILYFVYYQVVHGKKQTANKESRMYKNLQLLTSAAFSLGHGGADSQKVMGIICAALIVFGNEYREGNVTQKVPDFLKISEVMQLEYKNEKGKVTKIKPEFANKNHVHVYTKGDTIYNFEDNTWIYANKQLNPVYLNRLDKKFTAQFSGTELREGAKLKTKVFHETMPGWIAFSCYLMIGLGTLMGGWKIVKTMGTKITKVTPLEGVCAETAGALTLFTVSNMGIPVSTTHTITGSIIGVGATKRLSAVRWGVTLNLLWAWILTIPVSGLVAAIVYYATYLFR